MVLIRRGIAIDPSTPAVPSEITVHTALSLLSIWVLINMLFVVVMTPADDSRRPEPGARD
ncbi:hypothetical protein CK489_12030 [Bradyrhizobium sp. UFLA03-84]|nr:hypothetical protein CK489_12030 [Bradyrhizobium sp. UFLA03-84]